jgi:iron complex outermembrane receptor protein
MNLYLSYHRGYRTGGLTQISTDPTQPPLYAYKPEYSNGIELGSKAYFWNRRLTASLSFFYTVINDVQVPTLVLPQAITITKNAGKLVSRGVDLSLSALLAPGLKADYDFGYTRSVYTTLNLSENGSTEDLSGNQQIFTPDFTSRLALQYQFPLNARHTTNLLIRAEWIYIGKQYFDLANSISQVDYSLGNAGIGVNWNHLTLTGWVRNLANQIYIAYAYDFGATHLGDPRTYGLTLKVDLRLGNR